MRRAENGAERNSPVRFGSVRFSTIRQVERLVIVQGVGGCKCVCVSVSVRVCVYLDSLSCPCWVPWPQPSSYIQVAWKRACGHLERPISSQSVGGWGCHRVGSRAERQCGDTAGGKDR